MFRNYFKTAWRNIVRTPVYSTLNILGLAIGMAVALLIGLWVYSQYSFDKFLPDYDRLYWVQRNFWSNGDTLTFTSTSFKLADALRKEIPDIYCQPQSICALRLLPSVSRQSGLPLPTRSIAYVLNEH